MYLVPRPDSDTFRQAGWMGKGRDPLDTPEGLEKARAHRSAPLQTLTDPSSFGPPPKSPGYQGGVLAGHTRTAAGRAALAASAPRAIAAAPAAVQTPAARGAAPPIAARPSNLAIRSPPVELEKPAPPPVPLRADTTGIDVASLSKPPVTRRLQPEAAQPPGPSVTRPIVTASATGPVVKPKPQPPPRLPPRQNSNPDEFAPEPPPLYTPVAAPATQVVQPDKASLNRLGAAGVSVSAFGIGTNRSQASTTVAGPSTASSLGSDLQSRFTRMNKPSLSNATSTSPLTTPASGGGGSGSGTTWAQKQAALRTASDFQKDPSTVSYADMQSAASTANNFHARHGDQVKAGYASASATNQKYGVASKVGGAASSMGGLASRYGGSSGQETGIVVPNDDDTVTATAAPPQSPFPRPSAPTPISAAAGPPLARKKMPPALPPKRVAQVSADEEEQQQPPPALPMSSKPR